MTSTNVNNGASALTLDTSTIGVGKHILKVRYNSNALYNEAVTRSKLTINSSTP